MPRTMSHPVRRNRYAPEFSKRHDDMRTYDDSDEVKDAVRKKYAEIAARGNRRGGGPDGDSDGTASFLGDEYDDVPGYVADADLGLGCGVPTGQVCLEPGDAVLDLGSGAGLDAFVARSLVGANGTVAGVDITPEMVDAARANADALGYDNVRFHVGDVEELPFESASFNVVIGNCVLNLVPDKRAALAEMHRVLKPGGQFAISEVVTRGPVPTPVRRSAESYAGCTAGALEQEACLKLLRGVGFDRVEVARDDEVAVPDEALLHSARPAEVDAFRDGGGALMRVTVRGTRP